MKCKACGCERKTFPRTAMDTYCCPSCGAEQTGAALPMEDDYAEQLRKIRQAAVAEQERQAQEVRMKAEKASQDRREADALRRQKEQKVRKRILRERLLACIVPVAIIIFTIVLLRDPAAKGAGFLGFVVIIACLGAIIRALTRKK